MADINTLEKEELKTRQPEDGVNLKQTLEEYQKTIDMQFAELDKLRSEHDIAKRHLATLEVAFADVHQKYERSKSIITGYKNNEETLSETLAMASEEVRKSVEKYESLKAHAKAQIEKSNRELAQAREKYQHEIHKLAANIKRLEIKNASLNVALEQKTKECAQYAALCEEITARSEKPVE